MKTTLDLPDDLVREVKIRAVHEHRKLKDLVADLLRQGLARAEAPGRSVARRRVVLPIIKAAQDAPILNLTPERVHELEMEAEQERYEASLR